MEQARCWCNRVLTAVAFYPTLETVVSRLTGLVPRQIAFVSVQATFIHANIRFEFGPLRWVLATPQFHHWHHGAEREAIDKNFAVHLPVLDWLFGTFHLPEGRWPGAYGLAHGQRVPRGIFRRFFYPFRRRKGEGGA